MHLQLLFAVHYKDERWGTRRGKEVHLKCCYSRLKRKLSGLKSANSELVLHISHLFLPEHANEKFHRKNSKISRRGGRCFRSRRRKFGLQDSSPWLYAHFRILKRATYRWNECYRISVRKPVASNVLARRKAHCFVCQHRKLENHLLSRTVPTQKCQGSLQRDWSKFWCAQLGSIYCVRLRERIPRTAWGEYHEGQWSFGMDKDAQWGNGCTRASFYRWGGPG